MPNNYEQVTDSAMKTPMRNSKRRARSESPETPTLPGWKRRRPGDEYDTPHRAGLQSIVAWEEYNGRKPDKEAIFNFLNIKKSQGYNILAMPVQTLNNRDIPNPRGRPRILTLEKAHEIEFLLENEYNAQFLNWEALAAEVGIEAGETAIRRVMKEECDIVDGLMSKKSLLPDSIISCRIARAEDQLAKYPDWEDWMFMLWSDEVHFGWSDEGHLHCKRKTGTCDAPEHIQHPWEPCEKDRKRFHCWAAVGYNFKSKLLFYDAGNSNGKMTHKVYIKQILEPVVLPLIKKGCKFVLFEDGDSGYGTSKSNPVRAWKEKNGLTNYFNVNNSPDLNIIENCWVPPKQYVKKFPHWSDKETRALIVEGWEKVSQKYINNMVKSYPQRFHDLLKINGQMTGW